jgi:hypothetical protein
VSKIITFYLFSFQPASGNFQNRNDFTFIY